ncbi:MAG: cupin domain-containing protein [Longimicrobiales bacterium]
MSRHVVFRVLAVCFATALSFASAAAQQPPDGMIETDGRAVAFSPIDVPGFAPGLQIAPLQGDPSVPDQPYTLRLMFPDGYEFPAHFHPRAENLTVLSGTFYLAMGTTEDTSRLERYVPGDFLHIPATMAHYGGVRGETVVQLHGMGPFQIQLATRTATSGN